MVYYYKSNLNYFYKIYKNGKKKRVSREEFRQKGSGWNDIKYSIAHQNNIDHNPENPYYYNNTINQKLLNYEQNAQNKKKIHKLFDNYGLIPNNINQLQKNFPNFHLYNNKNKYMIMESIKHRKKQKKRLNNSLKARKLHYPNNYKKIYTLKQKGNTCWYDSVLMALLIPLKSRYEIYPKLIRKYKRFTVFNIDQPNYDVEINQIKRMIEHHHPTGLNPICTNPGHTDGHPYKFILKIMKDNYGTDEMCYNISSGLHHILFNSNNINKLQVNFHTFLPKVAAENNKYKYKYLIVTSIGTDCNNEYKSKIPKIINNYELQSIILTCNIKNSVHIIAIILYDNKWLIFDNNYIYNHRKRLKLMNENNESDEYFHFNDIKLNFFNIKKFFKNILQIILIYIR